MSFSAGSDIYYRSWHWIYAICPDQYFVGRGVTIGPGSHTEKFINSIGYSLSSGSIVKITSKVGVSIKGTYQNDSNGDISATARAGLIIKL
jgi:hypothetical protein